MNIFYLVATNKNELRQELRKITNEARLFSMQTFQDTIIDLDPGTYTVQITQSKKVPVTKGYTAVIHGAK
ncbi:hypothetical protein [Mastigocoleus sp. MO_188.B34]|uniref:hypothetical protein n=1 Tax=Mastigocoleus sp. MO_188.B34 TaxID=3036635 RepID=UPI00262A0C24|nr:hypothetical protein [Mastigocoleus sp. MO_188.B34]MDJ0694845.1 hypothetical protein [Mastigocoleus sp. MO_188.B34]